MSFLNILIITTSLLLLYNQVFCQQPLQGTCNGVFISYNYTGGRIIKPTDPTNQPYRFESTITVLNNGPDKLESWRVFIGFQNNEILVSANGAVIDDGSVLPAFVGNGTVLSGEVSQSDLESAIETAGDLSQMMGRVELVGTRFGGRVEDIPLPAKLSLVNHGYTCPDASRQGVTELQICCVRNASNGSNPTRQDEFQTRKDGDLIITYDIMRTYHTNYWAQVTVANRNPLVRLHNWKLGWNWQRDEFIYAMKGAYPLIVDTNECVFGSQGRYYKEMDFSLALNCERRPTIIDLPPTKANDTIMGTVPFCCRNGTILPPDMDATKAISSFEMLVFKMPPDLNRTSLAPPVDWQINGTSNLEFKCGNPSRVSPSISPDQSGLPSMKSAVASWQVACNLTEMKKDKPKCCVSFSAFYNDSVVPCNTCACGCKNNPSQTCSTTEPALFLPSYTLLVPFDNRTGQALSWAKDKKVNIPNPLPCPDNCGISINWHILSNFEGGWTARITLFNWDRTSIVDWFAAVELDKAIPGFEQVYSFNASILSGSNNTIFMQGNSGLNYLLGEQDSSKPRKNPPIPGMQQSVISFTKKLTPGIDVPGGDGFPTKVLFNGEECALPVVRPSSDYRTGSSTNLIGFLIVLYCLLIFEN